MYPTEVAWNLLQALYATAFEMGDGEFFVHIGLPVDAGFGDFFFHYQLKEVVGEGTDIDVERLLHDLKSHQPTSEAFADAQRAAGFTTEKYLDDLIEGKARAEKAGNAEAAAAYQSMIDEVLAGGKLKRQ